MPDGNKPREFTLVGCDGSRNTLNLTHQEALAFATAAAEAFGISKGTTVSFERDLAQQDLKEEGDKKKGGKVGKKTEPVTGQGDAS